MVKEETIDISVPSEIGFFSLVQYLDGLERDVQDPSSSFPAFNFRA